MWCVALCRVRGVGVENLGRLELEERKECYTYSCRAGVDFSIIRSLYESLSAGGSCSTPLF